MILCFTKLHGVWHVMAKFFEKSAAPSAIKIEAVYFFGHIANYVSGCTMLHDLEDYIMYLYHINKFESFMHLTIWPGGTR